MKLKFISDEALIDLRSNFKVYGKHYLNWEKEWFDQYFMEEGRVVESNIEMEIPKFNLAEDYAVSDPENTKIIYETLKGLTVSQATQEKLWAGLAHIQFRDFTYYRLKKDIDNKNLKRVDTALFFRNGTKRSLFVHIIARLWWTGYMTYDDSNKDSPYWLTDFFTESDFSARCTIFFSSNFTSNKNITKGILRALIKLKENGIPIKRDHFVQANKYLNIIGAVKILDLLEIDEVERLVGKHLCTHFGIENLIRLFDERVIV